MADQLGNTAVGALAVHLTGCAKCRADWGDLQAGFAALPRTTAPRLRASTRESVRRAVLADLRAPRVVRLFGAVPADGALSILFGAAATVASLLLLHARGLLGAVAPLALAAGVVAWTGVFILAFWTLLRRWDADPQLGSLVLGSLSAAGLFLVGNHLLPLPNVAQWCSSRIGAGLGPLFFALGLLYAAVPLVLFSMRTHRARPQPRRVLLASAFFFFLVAPAIFLQCAFFTAGALVAWLLGAVAGSVAGSAAGYFFARRPHPQS
jgi:hypothetical protein